MATPLKEIYNRGFYEHFCGVLEKVIPEFSRNRFMRAIFAGNWQQLELKQRIRRTTEVLHEQMPAKFSQAAILLSRIADELQQNKTREAGFEFAILPDYVEVYGLEDYEAAVKAMERITQFFSCEFAVRRFLLRYQKPMLAQMLKWSKHSHAGVRRLSSEGSRPRLPWGLGVPALKQNPQLVLPILENLKADPSEVVRRSVANSLNDISKDHPAVVNEILKKWKGFSPETDALLRHASRTLLKKADAKTLKHFGLHDTSFIHLEKIKIHTAQVSEGGSLEFSFELKNTGKKKQVIRLEYSVGYLRANGTHSHKVFKISEKEYAPGDAVKVVRRQSFRPITTRRYYPGRQELQVIANGKSFGKLSFVLKDGK